jgi:hypothetical protein
MWSSHNQLTVNSNRRSPDGITDVTNITSLQVLNRVILGNLNKRTKICYFISVTPSEIFRCIFTVSWLCGDYIAAGHLRHENPQLRTMAVSSPRRQRTRVLSWYWLHPASWSAIHGWGRLSAQWAGTNVKCFHLPIFPLRGILCGNGAPLFIYVCFWCGSPVTWVR